MTHGHGTTLGTLVCNFRVLSQTNSMLTLAPPPFRMEVHVLTRRPFVLWIVLVLLIAGCLAQGALADSYCGLPDNGNVHLPNPVYTDLATLPTPKGASYLDLAFNPAGPERAGCKITRLTDAAAAGIVPARYHHEYSNMSPFNSISTLILLHDAGFAYTSSHNSFFVVDRFGNVIRTAAELQVDSRGEPRWSIDDPYRFYYHTVSQNPNQVLWYDVLSNTRGAVYTGTGSTNLDFAGGEGDISADGNFMVLHVGPGLQKEFHRLDLDTGIPGPALHGTIAQPSAIDDACMQRNWCDITPVTNSIVCRFDAASGCTNPTKYELFDGSSGDIVRVITGAGGHADIGRDINGEEIMVTTNDTDSSLTGCYPGLFKINIQTLVRTCLVDYGHAVPPPGGSGPYTGWWGKGSHVSINNVGGHPWALISNYDFNTTSPDTREFNPSLPANWQQLWGKYFNEMFLVKLDGTQIIRLAHHRSREDGFFTSPRAALSRDGKYVLFDSNYALQTGIGMYTDVYLMPTTYVPPPPPGGGGGSGGGGGRQDQEGGN